MKMGIFFGWRNILLGFTVLSCCSGLEVSIPTKEYKVARGNDIAMTCSYRPARPNFSIFILKWEIQPDNEDDPWSTVATYFLNSKTDISPNYEGRAQMSVDLDTQLSTLRISNVQIEDSRTFQCSVTIQGDDEGVTAATTSLLVLVAPSKPVCKIQGDAEYWNNISLSCLSTEGSPIPTYSWKSYSVQNTPRPFPPRTTDKDGVLALFNISAETSGFFVCTSINEIASENCNLTLAVLPTSMKLGSTIGIVVGVLAGVVVLGIVIYCCCCKKDKQEQHAKRDPEEVEFQDQPSDRDQYWDDKSSTLTKPYIEESDHFEERSARDQQGNFSDNQVGKIKLDADRSSDNEDKDGQANGYESSSDRSRGRLDDKRGSRDRLDDRDLIHSSRDRLDDQRDRYRGSRDRLDDPREDVRGSRDRLDDPREDVRGSRDRLEDQRDRYRGSRDRLDDQRDDIRGSRDRLEDQRDRRYGSRDNLDAQHHRHGGSRDRLDDSSYEL